MNYAFSTNTYARILGTLLLVTICAIFSYSNVYANDAVWSTDVDPNSLSIGHGAKEEFYYWDEDKLMGAGGFFRYPTEFVPRRGGYTPKDNTVYLVRPGMQGDPCNTNYDDSWEMVLNGTGGLDFDLVGSNDMNGSWTYKEYKVSTGEKDSNGDIIWDYQYFRPHSDELNEALGQDTGGRANNLKTHKCKWDYSEGFNQYIGAYGTSRLSNQQFSGNLLGEKGMKFTEWTGRSDRINMFDAFGESSDRNTEEYCNNRSDPIACKAELIRTFNKCYNIGLGIDAQSSPNVNDVNDIAWETEINKKDVFKDFAKSFIDCYAESYENSAILKAIFPSEEAIKDFAKEILDEADIPPSILPNLEDADDDTEAKDETKCSIGKIGWIVCPALNFIALLNDQLFKVIGNWARTAPFAEKVSSQNSEAYQVWITMRNFANILFIILFMVMIYAQFTKIKAVEAYNLKTMIKKVVVIAFLVNISYFICATAVDLSNIVGTALEGSLAEIVPPKADTGYKSWEEISAKVILTGGGSMGLLTTAVYLAALVPLMVAAFLALIMTVLLLIFRQAFVIILVIVAPIAFAFLLLPSTTKLFNLWKGSFVAMMLVYPMIGLIFGGSVLASTIVRNTAANNGDILLTIFSLAIQAIPLFLTPFMIKAGSGVLNRFGGIINNPNKGPFDYMKRNAKQYRDDRSNLRKTRAANGVMSYRNAFGLANIPERGKMKRAAKLKYRKNNVERERKKLYAQNSGTVADTAAGKDRTLEDAKKAIETALHNDLTNLEKQEHEAECILLDAEDLSLDDIMTKARDPSLSLSERTAAVTRAVESGDVEAIHELVNLANKTSGNMNAKERKMLVDAIENSGVEDVAPHLDKDGRRSILEGDATVDDLYSQAAAQGKFTSEKLSKQSSQTAKGLVEAKNNGALGGLESSIRHNFRQAQADPNLRKNITSGNENEMAGF